MDAKAIGLYLASMILWKSIVLHVYINVAIALNSVTLLLIYMTNIDFTNLLASEQLRNTHHSLLCTITSLTICTVAEHTSQFILYNHVSHHLYSCGTHIIAYSVQSRLSPCVQSGLQMNVTCVAPQMRDIYHLLHLYFVIFTLHYVLCQTKRTIVYFNYYLFDLLLCLPHKMGETYCFQLLCLSVRLSVHHTFVSALYLLNP